MKKIISIIASAGILSVFVSQAFCAPVHEAAKSGDIAKLRQLLDKDPKLLNLKDEIGKTPVHWAVGKGQPAALQVMLDEYKADPNIRNNNDGTPLHVAASQAQPECARILLERGADVNARTRNNSTPLHFAAYKGRMAGHIEAARVLIEYGADVNAAIDTGATALTMATFRQNTEIIALLEKHGARMGATQRGISQGGQRGKGNYYIDE